MSNVKKLFTNEITLPPNNMREHVDRDALFELADDIKKNGLISPITVRPLNGKYELVAGQRRLLAHQYGGIIEIDCIVKELSDEEAFAVMTSENLARVDVNPVDESKHVGRLVEVKNGDIKSVAKIVGRSETWVRDRLAIASMPDYMQEMLASKQIKLGVALELIEITDERIRRMWCEIAVRDGVSQAQANYWVHGWRMNNLPGEAHSEIPPEGFIPEAPRPVEFECQLDGKKYDARLVRTVMIAEENLPAFYEFAKLWRQQSTQ